MVISGSFGGAGSHEKPFCPCMFYCLKMIFLRTWVVVSHGVLLGKEMREEPFRQRKKHIPSHVWKTSKHKHRHHTTLVLILSPKVDQGCTSSILGWRLETKSWKKEARRLWYAETWTKRTRVASEKALLSCWGSQPVDLDPQRQPDNMDMYITIHNNSKIAIVNNKIILWIFGVTTT